MKACASCGDIKAEYNSLCAPFESNADHVLIEAWRVLNKPAGMITVKIPPNSEITGKIRVSSIGVPYASESKWVRSKSGQRQHQTTA